MMYIDINKWLQLNTLPHSSSKQYTNKTAPYLQDWPPWKQQGHTVLRTAIYEDWLSK